MTPVRYPYAGQSVGEVRWRGGGDEAVTPGAQRAIRRVLDAWWGERRRVYASQLVAPFRLTTKLVVINECEESLAPHQRVVT